MNTLTGLPGTSRKEIECLFIYKGSDIQVILNNGLAATDANANGAINIWKDDEGFIRCEAMRYYSIVDSKKYKRITDAIKWADKWICLIK